MEGEVGAEKETKGGKSIARIGSVLFGNDRAGFGSGLHYTGLLQG